MAYPNPSSFVPLVIASTDGPTLTAAAAASCIPVASRLILPNNFWTVGKAIKITLTGRISTVITTPGTARFDVRTGPSGTIVAFDSGALNLKTAAATTNVPFWVEILLTCRTVGTGTSTTLAGSGLFQSEAVIGSPANTAGGNGSLLFPVLATTSTTGSAGFDNTAANALDMFFTQTVATGSMTVHQYHVWESI
jgi:hypothetical protein